MAPRRRGRRTSRQSWRWFEGDQLAIVAKLVAGGVHAATRAIAANAQGNDLNVAQTVVAGVAGAVTGVAETAGQNAANVAG